MALWRCEHKILHFFLNTRYFEIVTAWGATGNRAAHALRSPRAPHSISIACTYGLHFLADHLLLLVVLLWCAGGRVEHGHHRARNGRGRTSASARATAPRAAVDQHQPFATPEGPQQVVKRVRSLPRLVARRGGQSLACCGPLCVWMCAYLACLLRAGMFFFSAVFVSMFVCVLSCFFFCVFTPHDRPQHIPAMSLSYAYQTGTVVPYTAVYVLRIFFNMRDISMRDGRTTYPR